VVTLQRLLVTLNALRELGASGSPAAPDWARFRALVERGLVDLPDALAGRARPSTAPDVVAEATAVAARLGASGGPYDDLLAREVERVGWQIDGLRRAAARLAARAGGAPATVDGAARAG